MSEHTPEAQVHYDKAELRVENLRLHTALLELMDKCAHLESELYQARGENRMLLDLYVFKTKEENHE